MAKSTSQYILTFLVISLHLPLSFSFSFDKKSSTIEDGNVRFESGAILFHNREEQNRWGNIFNTRLPPRFNKQNIKSLSLVKKYPLDDGDDDDGGGFNFLQIKNDAEELFEESLISKCARNESLPFKVNGVWQCFQLLSQGPCKHIDDLFVLDKNSFKGKCIKEMCKNEMQIWYKGKCVYLFSKELCPRKMEMSINAFGEGVCDCSEGFHAYRDLENGKMDCFQLHLPGPCKERFQLEHVKESLKHPYGTGCVATNCSKGQIRWSNNQCLDSIMCSGSEGIVTYNQDFQTLNCGILSRQLLILPEVCPDGQSLNHEGVCKKITRLSQRLTPKRARRKRLTKVNLRLRYFLLRRLAGK